MGEKLELTDEMFSKIQLEDVSFKVIFTDIYGVETYISVPRDVQGETVHELFEVNVELDEDGNIFDFEDNEEESKVDGFTLAQAVGLEYNYEGIESFFKDEELVEVDRYGIEGDVLAVKYSKVVDEASEVLRHFKGDLLVAEYEYVPKENSTEEKEEV
jgi:hypothetical protein